VTLLVLLAPSGFSFLLLMAMARYERWVLDPGRAERGGTAERGFAIERPALEANGSPH
jgi:hypothetical protein